MKSLRVSLFLLCGTLLLRGQTDQQSHESIWPNLVHHLTVSNGYGQDVLGDFTVAIGLEYSAQLRLGSQSYAGLRTGFQLPEPGAGYALLPVQAAVKWLAAPGQKHPWYIFGGGGYALGWRMSGVETVNRVQGGWGGQAGVGRLWRVGAATWISTSIGYVRQQHRIEYVDFWWGDQSTLVNTTTMSRLQWQFGVFF